MQQVADSKKMIKKIGNAEQHLHDDVVVGDKTWGELKKEGCKPDYYDPNLSEEETKLLNSLIKAQIDQGDMESL